MPLARPRARLARSGRRGAVARHEEVQSSVMKMDAGLARTRPRSRAWDEPHAARRRRLPPIGQFKAADASQLFTVEARIGWTPRGKPLVRSRSIFGLD